MVQMDGFDVVQRCVCPFYRVCEDAPPLKKKRKGSLTRSLPPHLLSLQQVRPSLQGDRSTTPLVCYCPYGNGPPSTPQTLPLPFLFVCVCLSFSHNVPGSLWLVFNSCSCDRRIPSLRPRSYFSAVSMSLRCGCVSWSCSPENGLSMAVLI